MKIFSKTASGITILIGSLVILGWIFDISILKSILPHLASMKANSAISFIIAGLALWLLLNQPNTPRWHRIAQTCAAIVALIGLLTLSEYIFGWQLGIDQWLFKDLTGGASNLTPGRMSPTTALNFLFLGIALLLLNRGTPLGDRLAHSLALLIMLISSLALLGYLYGATILYGIGAYNQIAIHTATTFIIIALGLLCAYPDRGLMTIVTGQNAGSFTVRRLLPVAIILPVMLGWLRLQGIRAGLYDVELGQAIMVSSNILVIVGIIWWNARLLNKADAELKLALATDLRKNEERLGYVVWAIQDAIWDRNMISGEIWWNESLRKLFQYRDEDINPTFSWWEERIHPKDREKVIRSMRRVIETNQNFWSDEYRFQRADGSYANIFDRGYVVYNEQTGQPERMIGAMADTTKQKEMEYALRQSQELFSKAFSATPAGITITRMADGSVIEVNDAYLNMMGYRRSEVLGRTTLELGVITPKDRAQLLQILSDQGTVRDFEMWTRTKSGQSRAILSSLEQVEIGDDTCLLSVVYDITERKQAEIAQQQSETLFRTLFELSPDSVVIIDPYDPNISWPIIDCNAAACLMNGYSRDELIGHSIDILNGKSGTPDERNAYMKLLRELGSIKDEFQHRHKNGVIFPIETSTTLITIGERELIIGIDRDITARKQAEVALQQSEEKWHSLFEILPVGVSIINELKEVVEMNPALQKILQISKAGLAAGAYANRQYLHSDNTPITPQEFPSYRTIDEQQIVQDVEMCLIKEDDEKTWINVSAAPLPFADARAVIVTTDITARKHAEDALRESEQKFRSVIEQSTDGIVVIDEDGKIIEWNHSQEEIAGLSRTETIGQYLWDIQVRVNPHLAEPALYEQTKAMINQLLRTGQASWIMSPSEYTMQPPNGSPRTVQVVVFPIKVTNGFIACSITRDITQRKQAEEELRNINDNLTHGLAELDQHNHEMMLLSLLSNQLQTCQTPDEAYTTIGEAVPKIFPGAHGALYIMNASRNLVEAVTAWETLFLEERAFPLDDCLALRRGRPHFVAEYHSGLHCKHLVNPPISYTCIPMMAGGQALGMFHLQHTINHKDPKNLKPLEQGLVETVADTIALALTNLMLRETLRNQSIRDPLTGLFNRRFMEESLDREIHNATRNQRSLGIIMLDIDHFKTFNDTFGHEAGDTVLRELGNFLKDYVRKGDIACRYGGEEFLLLLPEASLENTHQRAQKLCTDARDIQIQHRGKTLGNITLSVGVAVFPGHGQLSDDVVRAADTALYRAKKAGRNRVVVAEYL